MGNEEYKVSSLGRIRGKHGKILVSKPGNSGYIAVPLRVNNAVKWQYAQRVVAMAFIPKVEGKNYVNHINGVRNDNRVTNLEWCTIKENNQKQVFRRPGQRVRSVVQLSATGEFIKRWKSTIEASRALGMDKTGIRHCCQGKREHTRDGSRWKYWDDYEPVDPNEIWQPFRGKSGDDIQVSNMGRIKTKSGVITKGSDVSGYLTIGKDGLVHRIVATVFCPNDDEKKNIVNHLDGNPHNNKASNLEWTTHQGNMIHARETGLRQKGAPGNLRPVRQYKDGVFIKEFKSLSEAAKESGASHPNIVKVCNGDRNMAAGFGWGYGEDAPPPVFPEAENAEVIDSKKVNFVPTISDDDAIWEGFGLSSVIPDDDTPCGDFEHPLTILDDDEIWEEFGLDTSGTIVNDAIWGDIGVEDIAALSITDDDGLWKDLGINTSDTASTTAGSTTSVGSNSGGSTMVAIPDDDPIWNLINA